MEDISCTAKGVGQGDSGAVADAAIVLAESSTDRDANTSDSDEESTTTCSEFHSARIESMLSSRSEFETELEYRTACSKVHWSELSHHEGASSNAKPESGSGESGTGSKDQSSMDHSQYFGELQKDAIWGGFCSAVADVVLGKKLGEGAQGVIYEAEVTFASKIPEAISGPRRGYVVKVMKSGCALEDLHRQWPRGLGALKDLDSERRIFSSYGALVKDHATGRSQFGLVMRQKWGDFRSLIDLRMERNNGKGPPFSMEQERDIIIGIAFQMRLLHQMGIIHRDLKAANVLVGLWIGKENCDMVSSNDPDLIYPPVADWECSVGVVGTGFWRAPEVLQQLKDGTLASELVFTKEMDVYNFAMTCYEIITGLVPFEGCPFNKTRDAILGGARPQLPQDMNPFIKGLITRCWNPNPFIKGLITCCWNPNPLDRPSFSYITTDFYELRVPEKQLRIDVQAIY